MARIGGRRCLTALVSATLFLAGNASAEQFVPRIPAEGTVTDGMFYLSLGGAVRVFNLPSYNSSIAFSPSGSPVFETSPSVVTGGGVFTLGMAVPRIGFGVRPRFEVAVGVLFGESSDDGSTPLASIRHPYTGFGPFTASTSSHLETEVSNFDAAFRFKTDFPLGNMLTVTPSIGVVGGRFRSKYTLIMNIVQPGLAPANNAFEDVLRTWSVGGEVGLAATLQLSPAWRLNAGVAGSIVQQHSRLVLADCLVAFGCALFNQSQTFTDRQLDFQVSGTLGATFSWGWGQISIAGLGTWNSDVPGVRRGTFNTGAVGANGIKYDDRFGYGGFVAVTIALP